MPRPRCRRIIGFLPQTSYFKPAGIRLVDLDEVVIQHDELEALRLKDLLGEQQEEAAKKMEVSQPTFHRLLQSAHQKIADALVNGKAIRIEGGNVMVETDQFPPCGWRERCRYGRTWQNPESSMDLKLQIGGNMKIAVSSFDGNIDGPVDERFGRSRKFIIYDAESKNHTVMDNTMNMGAAQGAGIQSAQNIINAGAKVLISGHLGPNAFRVLNTAGVEVFTTSGMTVRQAIEAYIAGRLNKLSGPDVSGHW
ncbi:MAG TPA: DUF134 domain-containing protein [Syntrophorhabdaceae bacterium]|nr:DUF134 domain-containing protein [Syntrophorhabdaceae bacterium]